MNKIFFDDLAESLDRAFLRSNPIKQLSSTTPLDLEAAYHIQKKLIKLRTERGESLSGYKLGFTSKAKMEQMGVHELIWGRLTDNMYVENGGNLNMNSFIHPRAEPEIAFLIGKNIEGPVTLDDAPGYIKGVTSAIEIIDSRYKDFKFSLEDVIADNCSSSAYVLGEWQSAETELGDLTMKLIINEETVEEGNSNAILGHPLNSLIEASKILPKYGETIGEGMVLLAGASSPAVYLDAGDQLRLECTNFNDISLTAK